MILHLYLSYQNLLAVQKIHFVHLQQYDENHCIYLASQQKKPAET